MGKWLTFFLLALAVGHMTVNAQRSPLALDSGSVTRHGPERGALLLIGGGEVTDDIWQKFAELSGAPAKASIVVITTASRDSAATRFSAVEEVKRKTGARDVVLLHTSDIQIANSPAFIAPIKRATGVFFIGGRQWRLADAYLNTLVHRALLELLDRGGVIDGTSAGATVQGSFLWRGDTRGAQILIGDHIQGFGFLKNSAIDQHLLTQNRAFDLVDLIKTAPELIGIGLDESTAALIQKDTLEVIGRSYVAIYDHATIVGAGAPFFFLGRGQRYDLRNRKVLPDVPGKRPVVHSLVHIDINHKKNQSILRS